MQGVTYRHSRPLMSQPNKHHTHSPSVKLTEFSVDAAIPSPVRTSDGIDPLPRTKTAAHFCVLVSDSDVSLVTDDGMYGVKRTTKRTDRHQTLAEFSNTPKGT